MSPSLSILRAALMVIWKIISLFILVHSVSVGNIAVVAAELPMGITVHLEVFSAVQTHEIISGFFVYELGMGTPPLAAAGVTAEFLLLAAGSLGDLYAAIQAPASACMQGIAGEVIAPAKAFHGVG